MWIARDNNGELYLYIDLPKRMEVNWTGDCIGGLSSQKYWAEDNVIDYITGYETLTWEDEPIEVELKIKDKKSETDKSCSNCRAKNDYPKCRIITDVCDDWLPMYKKK